MYVTVPYNKVLLSILYFFLTSQSEVDFGITLVQYHFQIESSDTPSYFQISFLIPFLQETFIRNIIIVQLIYCIIKIFINNNTVVNNLVGPIAQSV